MADAARNGVPLHTKILIGLIAGAGAGGTLNAVVGGETPALQWAIDHVADPIGQLFLRLPLLLVVPLVFSSVTLGVYSLSVALLSRINPIVYFRRIKTAMITAFSTSSSNATLPTALRVSEENLGADRILDMCRTVLNVTGDITIATYVARSEGYELMRETPEPARVDL